MKTLIILFALYAVNSATILYYGDQVLRLHPKTKLDIDAITKLESRFPSIDFWTDAHGMRPVDIHVSKEDLPAMKAFLTYSRLAYDVFIEDLQTAIDQQMSPRPQQMDLATFNYNVYHDYDEIKAFTGIRKPVITFIRGGLESLHTGTGNLTYQEISGASKITSIVEQWMSDVAAAYSTVTKGTYGTSYEGRAISYLKISTGGSNKPAFVIDCGLHSREWVSPATCIYTTKYFVEASPGSEEANILNAMDVYITPIGNPDGYSYTWTNDRMWRKTRSRNGGFCVGVDPNRNWDVNWSGPGADSSSCSDAYYGPSVMSEVEVSSKAAFIASIPNVRGYIDIHAYSQYWMHPYAYSYSFCPDDGLLRSIGLASVNAIRSVHGMSYQYGPISEVIYQASGSTTDYMYQKLGITCSFAAELRDTGRYGFTLPERFIQPTAEETFAGLKVIASNIQSGTC